MTVLDQIGYSSVRTRLLTASLEAGEFPISRMSRQLAESLESCWPRPKSRALDVGTGTGIHALLLKSLGYSDVLAIDRNSIAIQQASRRSISLGIKAQVLAESELSGYSNGHRACQLRLCSVDLDDLAVNLPVDTRFDLIVFNPPGFFSLKGTALESPVASGVYSSDADVCLEVESSLIYRFFRNIVMPLLAPDGVVVMTWPGLEKRVVDSVTSDSLREHVVHPIELLESWFAIEILTANSDPADFYRYNAVISGDYGLGPSFDLNLETLIARGDCYSSLVTLSDPDFDGLPTFRFGVLKLKRSISDSSRFSVLEA